MFEIYKNRDRIFAIPTVLNEDGSFTILKGIEGSKPRKVIVPKDCITGTIEDEIRERGDRLISQGYTHMGNGSVGKKLDFHIRPKFTPKRKTISF